MTYQAEAVLCQADAASCYTIARLCYKLALDTRFPEDRQYFLDRAKVLQEWGAILAATARALL